MRHVVWFACLAIASTAPAQLGWSSPTLVTALNSTAADTGPNLSKDGLSVYFSSFRSGNWEIYSATRTDRLSPWSAPVLEAALGGTAVEDQPFIMPNGVEIYFTSTRTGGTGSSDIMRAVRPTTGSPWGAPTFVTELNSSAAEGAISVTDDGLEAFILSAGFGNPNTNNSIFKAVRTSTALPFSTPTVVTELYNGRTHRDANITGDGLGLYYTEFDTSISPNRIRVYHATRPDRLTPFSPSQPITAFDAVGTSLGVYGASPSSDETELILAAGFTTAQGGQELLSTRFNGLTAQGVAGPTSVRTLSYRDGGAAAYAYVLAASLGNTGFNVGPLFIPIDADDVFLLTLGTDIPPITTGFFGILDNDGMGVGTASDPPAVLNGLQLYVCAATIDPLSPFGASSVSNAVTVRFQ